METEWMMTFRNKGYWMIICKKNKIVLNSLNFVTKASSNKQCTTLCRRFNLSLVPLLGCSSTCVSLSTNASEASKVSNNRVLANTGCPNKFGIC